MVGSAVSYYLNAAELCNCVYVLSVKAHWLDPYSPGNSHPTLVWKGESSGIISYNDQTKAEISFKKTSMSVLNMEY